MTATPESVMNNPHFSQDDRLFITAKKAVENNDVDTLAKLANNPNSGYKTLGIIFGGTSYCISSKSVLSAYKDNAHRKIIGSTANRVLTDDNMLASALFFPNRHW